MDEAGTALQLSHDAPLLQAFAEFSPAPLFIADTSGNWIYANRACREVLRFEDGRSLDWQIRIHPDDRNHVASDWLHSVQGGLQFHREVRLADPGKPPVRIWASPIRDPNGRPVGHSGTIQALQQGDHQCAQAIRSIRELLQGTENALPEVLRSISEAHGCVAGILWAIDRRAGVLRVAESWCDMAAPAAMEFVGVSKTITLAQGRGLPGRVWASEKPTWLSNLTEEVNFPRAACAASAGLHSAFAFPVVTGNGIAGIMEFFATAPLTPPPGDSELLAALGQRVGALMEKIDATEALRKSEELLRTTADEIGEVFWCWDAARQHLLYVSGAYETIWGRSRESLFEKPDSFFEAVHPDDRVRVLAYLDSQSQGTRAEEEYRILRRDGSIRWIRDRSFPVRNSKGEIERIAGIATDTTLRKRVEEQIRQAQKHEALGFLVAGLAHDFNNLLTAIMGNASLAITELGPGHRGRERMSEIVVGAERAAKLIQQMLAYAGKGRHPIRGVDLSHVASSAVEFVEFGPAIRVSLHLASGLPPMKADPDRIRQLTENLLWNAVEAISDAPGEIVVATGVRLMGANERNASFPEPLRPGTYLFIEISDNGCGMDESTKARIFDPFFTTKFMGRGLGLAAVLGIVRANHGAIRVSSAPGQGSVFTVFLPSSSDEEPNTILRRGGEESNGNREDSRGFDG